MTSAKRQRTYLGPAVLRRVRDLDQVRVLPDIEAVVVRALSGAGARRQQHRAGERARGAAGRVHDHIALPVGVHAMEIAIRRTGCDTPHQIRFGEARQLCQIIDTP